MNFLSAGSGRSPLPIGNLDGQSCRVQLGLNDQAATKECIYNKAVVIPTSTKQQNESGSYSVHIAVVVRLPSATQ